MMRDAFDLAIYKRFENVERTIADMHGYQDEAWRFLLANPFSALFIDMGMGKTISSLTLAAHLLNEFMTDKVLVVGPLKVITDTWPTEVGIWQHTAGFNFTVLRCPDDDPRLETARQRARQFGRDEGLSTAEINRMVTRSETQEAHRIREELTRSNTQIHFINREQLEWLCEFWQYDWPYRTVIIDESSSFKDHTSIRFKALANVRRQPGLIDRLHLLTATPAAETYEHLFAQIYLLDLGERFGKFITHYRERYFNFNKYQRKYKLRPGGEEDILAKIADITLVFKAKDYLKLDEPTIQEHPVILEQKQLDLIKQMETEFIVTLPDGSEVEADTAAALSAKLLQMSSGVLYDTQLLKDWETDDMKKVRKVHHLHDHKIDALREIFESAQESGQTVLVSYHFKSSLDRLLKAFPKSRVMDKEAKLTKDWNAGKIPMLLLHPQSGGHGLNLQKGGHLIVFFDIPWSLELFLQLIGRLARQGQKHPVLVRLLVAKGTRDEIAAKALMMKKDAQDLLFRILKKAIKKYRDAQRFAAMQVEDEEL